MATSISATADAATGACAGTWPATGSWSGPGGGWLDVQVWGITANDVDDLGHGTWVALAVGHFGQADAVEEVTQDVEAQAWVAGVEHQLEVFIDRFLDLAITRGHLDEAVDQGPRSGWPAIGVARFPWTPAVADSSLEVWVLDYLGFRFGHSSPHIRLRSLRATTGHDSRGRVGVGVLRARRES